MVHFPNVLLLCWPVFIILSHVQSDSEMLGSTRPRKNLFVEGVQCSLFPTYCNFICQIILVSPQVQTTNPHKNGQSYSYCFCQPKHPCSMAKTGSFMLGPAGNM